MHLTISVLLQAGQLNFAVPFEFEISFLHDEHANFWIAMSFWSSSVFIKVIVHPKFCYYF